MKKLVMQQDNNKWLSSVENSLWYENVQKVL
jgi:hypothetical protein